VERILDSLVQLILNDSKIVLLTIYIQDTIVLRAEAFLCINDEYRTRTRRRQRGAAVSLEIQSHRSLNYWYRIFHMNLEQKGTKSVYVPSESCFKRRIRTRLSFCSRGERFSSFASKEMDDKTAVAL
jgi:hypothetical protein